MVYYLTKIVYLCYKYRRIDKNEMTITCNLSFLENFLNRHQIFCMIKRSE